MSTPPCFFDSNILLQLTSSDPQKRSETKRLMRAGGVISVQSLNETSNVCRRKLSMEWHDLHKLLGTIRDAMQIVPVTLTTHEVGIRLAERYQFSIYDSLLVAAAQLAGCDVFYSEDMHNGLVIENQLRIVNPFRLT